MELLKCEIVQNVLTEKDIKSIVDKAASEQWDVVGHDFELAGQGLSGFLGDHFRLTIHLRKGDFTQKLLLFAKCLPLLNKPKAAFIKESNFFRRENLMYKLFEEMRIADEPSPWCPKALIHTDELIVMPDLSTQGYSAVSHHHCLDLQHVSSVVSSLARFHASFACYEAKRDLARRRQNSFYADYKNVLRESLDFDAPWTETWLRAAAKVSFDLLQEFSSKFDKNHENLQDKIFTLFIKSCEDIMPSKDSLNVIIHRDLWMNNILFRYEASAPTEAVLLDFQCVRYAPPALDLMIFLYLTTSKEFRLIHEEEVFNHYYSVFTQHLDDTVKGLLKDYNYGRWEFFKSCEHARLFAMTQAMAIFPFTLMDPTIAQKTFDNPDTFTKLMEEDRSAPVLAAARDCAVYRQRQLEVTEEFVDRYVFTNFKSN